MELQNDHDLVNISMWELLFSFVISLFLHFLVFLGPIAKAKVALAKGVSWFKHTDSTYIKTCLGTALTFFSWESVKGGKVIGGQIFHLSIWQKIVGTHSSSLSNSRFELSCQSERNSYQLVHKSTGILANN